MENIQNKYTELIELLSDTTSQELKRYKECLPKKSKYSKLFYQYENVQGLNYVHYLINEWFRELEKSTAYSSSFESMKIDFFLGGVSLYNSIEDISKRILFLSDYVNFLHNHAFWIEIEFGKLNAENAAITNKILEKALFLLKPTILEYFFCFKGINESIRKRIVESGDYELFVNEFYHYLDKREVEIKLLMVVKILKKDVAAARWIEKQLKSIYLDAPKEVKINIGIEPVEPYSGKIIDLIKDSIIEAEKRGVNPEKIFKEKDNRFSVKGVKITYEKLYQNFKVHLSKGSIIREKDGFYDKDGNKIN